jgi:hypothetical protein
LIPVDQIEPAFTNLVAVCTELPTPSGFVDNLLITPNGDIALVECKLWRNPDARRKVVAQIIDYAKDLVAWSFDDLQTAVGKAIPPAGDSGIRRTLFELVSEHAEIDEASFIDAVSRNLRRGRFLLLVVGDGIREGVEAMTEFLQQYAGLHFTLSLVELSAFRLPEKGYIVQPRVLAKTINIERGIVSFEDSRVVVSPPKEASIGSAGATRRTSITQEQYFEQLEKTCPGISEKLKSFIDVLPKYEIVPEFGSSLILRWSPEWTTNWNLATVYANGNLSFDILGWQAKEAGLAAAHIKLLETLALLIPGGSIRKTPKPNAWYVVVNGKCLSIDILLSSEAYTQGWLDATSEFQATVKRAQIDEK